MRRIPEVLLPASVAAVLAAYWSACGLLIHHSFHSNAWDLGILTQVTWNTGRGEPFEYSFRAISYAGDHWQPALLLFAPLMRLGAGAGTLVVCQAILLAVAMFPLYYAVRHRHTPATAALVCVAYGLSLGVAQAVSFDFHLEAVAPLFAFSAVLGLVVSRDWLFLVSSVSLLTLKEDAALLVLGLAGAGLVYYGHRWKAAGLTAIALVYAGVVNLWLIPHYRGDDLNPLRERYGYLGDSVPEILLAIPTHPAAVFDHVVGRESLEVVVLLILASGAGLVLRPVLGLLILPLIVLPLLSEDYSQSRFELHYLLVPATFATCALVVHMDRLPHDMRHYPYAARRTAAAVAAVGVVLFAARSPLPPSFSADMRRFDIDAHARIADRFVDEIPPRAIVSAQSPFVPHLATRTEIFVFPRVLTAEYVLIDDYGPKPLDDLAAGYDVCREALPRLGFEPVREEDGIQLWRKERPAQAALDLPPSCSGEDR